MGQTPKSTHYRSTLREQRVIQTKKLILDAAASLLVDRGSDKVTTRKVASTAGVSERTVYRHFPDREALLQELAQRLPEVDGFTPSLAAGGLDNLPATGRLRMELFEENPAAALAQAALADPRGLADDAQTQSQELRQLLANEFPDLDKGEHLRVAAVLGCLLSSQAWLRMREEFGVPGTESGPVVAWVIETIVRELRAGNTPKG